MQCRFSFKHMKSSQKLIDYAERKITQKMTTFMTKPIEAHITFSEQKHEKHIHISVLGGDGFNIQIEAEAKDGLAVIDSGVSKLEAQLRKKKGKITHHKNAENIRHMEEKEEIDPADAEAVAVDAGDLIKFEKAVNKDD